MSTIELELVLRTWVIQQQLWDFKCAIKFMAISFSFSCCAFTIHNKINLNIGKNVLKLTFYSIKFDTDLIIIYFINGS